MNVLKNIVAKKIERVEDAQCRHTLSEIKKGLADLERPRDFREALKREHGPIKLIAEIKKASASSEAISIPCRLRPSMSRTMSVQSRFLLRRTFSRDTFHIFEG